MRLQAWRRGAGVRRPWDGVAGAPSQGLYGGIMVPPGGRTAAGGPSQRGSKIAPAGLRLREARPGCVSHLISEPIMVAVSSAIPARGSRPLGRPATRLLLQAARLDRPGRPR